MQAEVGDTGEEITAEDLPHIWERFYRSSKESPTQGIGAGLGLALVNELTEVIRGTVSAECFLGKGSKFTVQLPKA